MGKVKKICVIISIQEKCLRQNGTTYAGEFWPYSATESAIKTLHKIETLSAYIVEVIVGTNTVLSFTFGRAKVALQFLMNS
jgi:hypothetical protein